jgi:uncharacterized membrane protein YiaA
MKASLTRIACELFMVAGLFAFVYGLWLAWHPLGWMIGGLLLAACAFFVHYNALRDQARNESSGRVAARERVIS